MKRKLFTLFLLAAFAAQGSSQNFYYDIWFDSNRQNMRHGTFVAGENTLQLDLSEITSAGLHFLNVIPYYEWGEMGQWRCIPFIMPEGWPYSGEAHTIEYWVYGYDSAPKTIPYTEPSVQLDIDVSKMSYGLHFLNVRTRNEAGEAGFWKQIPFYLSNFLFDPEEMDYEYWIDDETNKVTGKGVFPGSLELDVDLENFAIDTTHKFYFRGINQFGTYGEIYQFAFTYSKPPYQVGDVNEDGSVDISDIVAVINEMAGNASYRYSDVNADTRVDISDIVAIINIMAGLYHEDEENADDKVRQDVLREWTEPINQDSPLDNATFKCMVIHFADGTSKTINAEEIESITYVPAVGIKIQLSDNDSCLDYIFSDMTKIEYVYEDKVIEESYDNWMSAGIDTESVLTKISIRVVDGKLIIESNVRGPLSIFNLNGALVRKVDLAEGQNVVNIPKGMYVIEGLKFIVK